MYSGAGDSGGQVQGQPELHNKTLCQIQTETNGEGTGNAVQWTNACSSHTVSSSAMIRK